MSDDDELLSSDALIDTIAANANMTVTGGGWRLMVPVTKVAATWSEWHLRIAEMFLVPPDRLFGLEVLEISPDDSDPGHEVGEIVPIERVDGLFQDDGEGFYELDDADRNGTWCKVRPVRMGDASPWKPPARGDESLELLGDALEDLGGMMIGS